MPLLLAENDWGLAIEGIARLYEGLLIMAFALVVVSGLVIVFLFARQRRLAERRQVRFKAQGREALGLSGLGSQRGDPP